MFIGIRTKMNPSEEQMNTHLDSTRKILVVSTSEDTEELIHNNQHLCDVCTKTFTKASLLLRHQSIHKGTRYPCTLFDNTFSRAFDVKKHIETVHKGTRYPCTLCDKTFSQSGNLKTHFRMKHRQDQEESSVIDNASDMHAEEQDRSQIHSFIVKIEEESEEEDSDTREEV